VGATILCTRRRDIPGGAVRTYFEARHARHFSETLPSEEKHFEKRPERLIDTNGLYF
jgi:hypothetical protein